MLNRITSLFNNSVGQKLVTALTGLGLIAFIVAHLVGNLQMFAGQDAINAYAVKLKSFGPLLWIARLGLVLLIVLHVGMTISLRLRNRRAAGGPSSRNTRRVSTVSSRNMMISGSFILTFVIFHLLHFTVGWVQPAAYALEDSAGRHDVYTMVIRGFENWGIAAFYVAAMLLLMSHLTHATFSVFQTLGVLRMRQDTRVKVAAKVFAIAMTLGFIAIPLAVMVGILRQ